MRVRYKGLWAPATKIHSSPPRGGLLCFETSGSPFACAQCVRRSKSATGAFRSCRAGTAPHPEGRWFKFWLSAYAPSVRRSKQSTGLFCPLQGALPTPPQPNIKAQFLLWAALFLFQQPVRAVTIHCKKTADRSLVASSRSRSDRHRFFVALTS